MNTLRNFVVIFFLGVVVFLAGVMVGKSMRDNAKNPLLPGAKKIVVIPRQVVPVAPLTQDGNSGEIPAKPPVKESLPLPLATAAADNQAAGEQGRDKNGFHESRSLRGWDFLCRKPQLSG